jgi:hypothetical protein
LKQTIPPQTKREEGSPKATTAGRYGHSQGQTRQTPRFSIPPRKISGREKHQQDRREKKAKPPDSRYEERLNVPSPLNAEQRQTAQSQTVQRQQRRPAEKKKSESSYGQVHRHPSDSQPKPDSHKLEPEVIPTQEPKPQP